eukprot:SAG11_NODE_1662_length_4497_cov_2.281492_1_plen_95_part_00
MRHTGADAFPAFHRVNRALRLRACSRTASTVAATRLRVLSGIQPTGQLHLGNYYGALRTWVRNQVCAQLLVLVVQHALINIQGDSILLRNTGCL